MNLADELRFLMTVRGLAPVPVHVIPEAMGISFKEACLENEISGMIERKGPGFAITINAKDPHTRRRFTLAHELGHYMLHRHLIGDGLDDDRLYRSSRGGKYHNTAVGPKEETEANRFAANLLMPKELVEFHRKELDGNVAEMAKLFQVSKHSMFIRMGVPYKD
ncbi:MAG: ImmA/IrrE family metallo-endopeptidase [Aestuariivita sp.]|nr:ImmA/IrrE family metallo-endopeptidase [Aestuariivita sp.]